MARQKHERFEFFETTSPRERAVIVGVDRQSTSHSNEWPIESSLAELKRLAFTDGADVVCSFTQRLTSPDSATFIGSGKLSEIRDAVIAQNIDIVIFDDELTPTQQSNLERALPKDVKVIDRTALILDIFAMHAKTREGRLQVRLAQNEYLYPRLRGMWSHLASNRMGGGVGSRFGEGESQLEVDRRIVRNRITSIKRELKTLAKVRHQQRRNRYASGVYKIVLVGYTNAGKSSLLNTLCDEEVYSDDLLFATLDSTTRKLHLPDGRVTTLTDTVGFIQKLPTTLIESFKSTLDEVSGADLLLHVIDISDAAYIRQMEAVGEILSQIDASNNPRLIVFNKSDLLDEDELSSLKKRYQSAIFVSAEKHKNIDSLLENIIKAAASTGTLMRLVIPYEKGNIVSKIHERCHIISQDYVADGTLILARVPFEMRDILSAYEREEG